MSWFGSWMLNPAMLGLGALAVSIPIIIHLLNRRRFKVVEWAAMEFLLDANRKNRRRIKIENILLLLLRCLAMLLIGLMLARPFLSSALPIFGEQPVERIVLLDDSLSTTLKNGNSTVFDNAKEKLETTLRSIAAENRGDLLTMFLTSNPESPVFANKPINAETQNEFSDLLKTLEPSDKSASMETSLQEVSSFISGLKQNSDRLVYIISDMRERDWKDDSKEENENSARNLVKAISEQVTACYMVDAGIDASKNLVITRISPQEGLRSGVSNRFDVVVSNRGSQTVESVRVRFQVGDGGVEKEDVIKRIAAGEQAVASFSFMRTVEDDGTNPSGDASTKTTGAAESIRVTARILSDNPESDLLEADSEAYFAARVEQGNPVLVVDGDPSLDAERSESLYIGRAITPPDFISGNALEVATYSEFETLPISRYQVIYLCNVDELSEARMTILKEWVADGGGLVIMPGDRVIAETYNKQFYEEGKGVSPVKLTDTFGDVNEARWANFSIPETVHPMVEVFSGQNNPFLEKTKIFSWWGNVIDPKQEGKSVQRIAGLTDDLGTPAIVEKSYGNGRVIFTAFPSDRDWTDWTDSPSYVVFTQETIRHLSEDRKEEGDLQIGQTLQVPLDLSLYQRNASIRDESDEKYSVQAIPTGDDEKSKNSTIWQVRYDDVNRRGFYDLTLTNTSGTSESLLFAANVDPREGDLRPLDMESVGNEYFGAKTKLVQSSDMAVQSVNASQNEFWRYLLYALFAILGIELVMGWLFGRRR